MIKFDKYLITPMEFDYKLEEKKITKEGKNAGKERLDIIGYFPSIKTALMRIRNIEASNTLNNSVLELDEVVNVLKEIDAEFTNFLENNLDSLLAD